MNFIFLSPGISRYLLFICVLINLQSSKTISAGFSVSTILIFAEPSGFIISEFLGET